MGQVTVDSAWLILLYMWRSGYLIKKPYTNGTPIKCECQNNVDRHLPLGLLYQQCYNSHYNTVSTGVVDRSKSSTLKAYLGMITQLHSDITLPYENNGLLVKPYLLQRTSFAL